MKTTAYFRDVVCVKRPYLTAEVVTAVLAGPLHRAVQADGRHRLWGLPPSLPGKVVRIVLLPDGETVHNGFIDRSAPPEVLQSRDRP